MGILYVIIRIAVEQPAIEANCKPEDFCRFENLTALTRENEKARRYLKLPVSCNLISYGSNIVASVNPAVKETVQKYIDRFEPGHCFEMP